MKRNITILTRQQMRLQKFLMTAVGTEANRFFMTETQDEQFNGEMRCVCNEYDNKKKEKKKLRYRDKKNCYALWLDN